MRFYLVPEYGRGDIVLQRQVSSAVAPSKGLDGHLQAFFEADGVCDMPAVETEALLAVVVAVAADHLWQARVGAGEFGIVRFGDASGVLCSGVEVIATAEIVFRSRSADSRPLGVAIHIEFDLAFAPPAVVVDAPGHIGADVLAFAFYVVEEGVVCLVWQRVGAVKLGVEIRGVAGDICEQVVDLVVEHHFLDVDIFEGYAAFLAERHRPVAVEGATGVDTDGEALKRGVASPSLAEEVPHRCFDGGGGFVVPVYAEDGIAPVTRGCHPDMLDAAGAVDLGDGIGLAGGYVYGGAYLPALAEFAGGVGAGAGRGFSAAAFCAVEVLGADTTAPGVGEAEEVAEAGFDPVEGLLGVKARG